MLNLKEISANFEEEAAFKLKRNRFVRPQTPEVADVYP